MRPGITVCIPSWNGAAFIGETLAAVARQTVRDLRVLVSVDGNDMATAEACRPFMADPRFGLVVQPRRLGWVGNTNALIAAVETGFFAIMPHDDLPEPDWLATLLRVLRRQPQAVCAFGDVEAFGAATGRHVQRPVAGSLTRRMLETVLEQHPCVAYRGLVRRRDDADRPLIPTGLPGDVMADTAWIAELARRGELRRVPRVLVHKRFHRGNTHTGWARLPPAARAGSAAALLHRMRAAALDAVGRDEAARALVNTATLLRLFGCGATLMPDHDLPDPAVSAAFWRGLPPSDELRPLAAP
uniref:glycosyltransferase family 2 protein n=1 Tax=Falsiroseomonas oryzae TaxID=2766473 RepID=UPI0022EA6C53